MIKIFRTIKLMIASVVMLIISIYTTIGYFSSPIFKVNTFIITGYNLLYMWGLLLVLIILTVISWQQQK